MGTGDWGLGIGNGRQGRFYFNALCPMPHTPCPMPHAPCPMPHALLPMPHSHIFNY
ncbi:hypothetical protein [Nostoc sp. CMAA1605]|uniref:hypothetical protein n=1 Tax=Nostoc sp. CMAA1605 TaxID=2055159 RepID=UPI001F19B1FB|nr:hypothetical protein [Nostoc sp. CMAA1605]